MIAEFLLPPSNILLRTYRDLSAIMKEIRMQYETIHAFHDNYVIYYNRHEFATECSECHISRYRTDQVTKNVPHKVLHYIPIIPHLQRMFTCKNIVQFMDYHARNRIQDDVIRMPTDGSSFRDMEEKWSHFKEEPRNLRISLVANSVNPFTNCGLFLLSTISFLHGCQ